MTSQRELVPFPMLVSSYMRGPTKQEAVNTMLSMQHIRDLENLIH